MALGRIGRWGAALALALTSFATAQAADADFKSAFDAALGTDVRAPQSYEAVYSTALEETVADLNEFASSSADAPAPAARS